MTVEKKLDKIGKCIENHEYRKAESQLASIRKNKLILLEKRKYDIYMAMVMAHRADLTQQYNHVSNLVSQYNNEVVNFHYLMVRLHYLIQGQSKYRSSIIFDLIEIKVCLLENRPYLLIFKLEKATYYTQLGEHGRCLRILESFQASDIPCPLMYYETKVKALIELGLEKEIENLMDEVNCLAGGLKLEINKKETLCAIRLRIAIYYKNAIQISLLTSELRGILQQMEIPFSANHTLMIKGYLGRGFTAEQCEQIINTFEVTFISKPFLERLKNEMNNNYSVGLYQTVENVAEMIF